MSVSQDFPTPNLFCNEEAIVVLSQDSNFSDHILSNLTPDEESLIVNAFDSEIDQVLNSDSIQKFRNDSGLVSARLEAVNWILKVHDYYQFRPETAYLSVNYLDRCLLSGTWPKEREWSLQLISVACLALAAKMEEISPSTIQKMELMVLGILKWQLRLITPFDFVHYFLLKLSCFGLQFEHYDHAISNASEIIVLSCREIDFLDYTPSEIAAAAMLCAATDEHDDDDDDQILECFHQRVSRENVRKCYNLMKQSIYLLQVSHSKKVLPPSPVGILDAAIAGAAGST
ncbi:hypothetical protein UlMin_039012 [Ulmus minor]